MPTKPDDYPTANPPPALPDGWRFLTNGDVVKAGDRVWDGFWKRWLDCDETIGAPLGRYNENAFIRKIT